MPSPLRIALAALPILFAGCAKPDVGQRPSAKEADPDKTFKRTLKIESVSSIPDPRSAPYRDCLFVVTAEVLTPERFAGQTVNLALWAFRDRTLQDSTLVRPGDEVVCRLVDYPAVPDIAAIQLVDEVGDLDAPTWYAERMRNAADTSGREPTAVTQPLAEPTLDLDAQLAMLRHMHDTFAARGTRLVVVPFPFREQVSESYTFENPEHDRFIDLRQQLIDRSLAAEIATIDLAPAFTEASAAGEKLYYPGDDDHPADAAIRLAARFVSSHLLENYSVKKGDLEGWGTREIAFSKQPGYVATQVVSPDGQPLSPAASSPILVLGDSYARYPESTPFGSVSSANFASHLAYELGTAVAQFSVSSGGAVMPRALARRPELHRGARICVFLFSPYYPWFAGEAMWEQTPF